MQLATAENGQEVELARAVFRVTGDPTPVLARRTAVVEATVRTAGAEFLLPEFSSGLAVLAVGGFGREELFPHSDIDVLVLLARESAAAVARDAVAGFLRSLWDQRLRVSQSVRSLSDCLEIHEGNLEFTISLLDHRYLLGDRRLYNEFAERFPGFLHGRRGFVARRLNQLSRTRHAKFENSIYHLEPNIKETPGGLRDLHLLWWLAKLRTPRPEDTSGGFDGARRFLHAMRCFLHYESGRDNNLLDFETQEKLAAQPAFGYRSATELMREYYRHARAIHRTALRELEAAEAPGGTLLAQFRDWRSRFSNADFTVSRERVFLKSPHAPEHDAGLVLRLFRFVARHGFRLAPDTERRLRGILPHPEGAWDMLREILELPHAALALREMHDSGVLGGLFPEWDRIDCLVVRDFYHRYTVDEHTLVAIQELAKLKATQDPQRRRFAELLAEIDRPALLSLALLFHDTGKGRGSGKHIEEALENAEAAMGRIGVPHGDRKVVRFLIDRHLDLSAAMSARDLDDDATVRAMARHIETIEQLKALTLLTFADISAVHPSAMTPWRLEQLWRAYLAVQRELTRALDTDRIEPASVPGETAGFLAGFPTRYLRVHSEEEIVVHLDLDRRCRVAGVAIDLRRHNGVYTLAVATRDRPGLFASLAGALSGFGLNILKAEAFSNRQGRVLDTFVVSDPSRTLDLNPPEVERLRINLERVALGKTDVKDLLKGRPKPPPPTRQARIRPAVHFDNAASASSTLIEIVAEDRPGLLYDLASTFSNAGCNIEVVLIDTEAHKALDVFYVTWNGGKLTPDIQASLHARLLRIC